MLRAALRLGPAARAKGYRAGNDIVVAMGHHDTGANEALIAGIRVLHALLKKEEAAGYWRGAVGEKTIAALAHARTTMQDENEPDAAESAEDALALLRGLRGGVPGGPADSPP